MKVKCNCGFEDLPENFHAVQKYEQNGDNHVRMIYIECPACTNQTFFQHFRITENETVKDLDICGMSMSHIFTPSDKEVEKYGSVQKAFDNRVNQFKERMKLMKVKYID